MENYFEDYYIRLAGERFAVEWLEEKGFSIMKWDREFKGSKGIEANSKKHLLVYVKTTTHPTEEVKISKNEENKIISKAREIRAEPWEAIVRLDSKLGLIGKIKWRKLSK